MSRAPKPHHSSGRRVQVVVDPSSAPGLGAHAPVIKVGEKREPLPRRAIRSTVGLVAATGALLAMVYAVLAVTVLVAMPAGDHRALVLRGAFPVGQAPAGAFVYASSSPVDYSFMGKVTEAVAGVPTGAVVQIVTGPASTVSTNPDGFIVADGAPTRFKGDVVTKDLEREYVAICIAGACKEGAAVVIGQENIIGGVRGLIGLDGIQQPSSARVPGTPR